GQTKEKLKALFPKGHLVDDLEEAMALAIQISQAGDVVLLSPACASFDQYKSFEERGDHFIALVENI
ncbi:MAG TPA: UDP-N-acetylmuramoyl-L-alanine--D-glutamate ligase, partial [Erysipelothrix sp.]|nr:UDP-N-acetylmuramoyl-L-alanine--D-glutamate ligase [Erysipelothrix sp.]